MSHARRPVGFLVGTGVAAMLVLAGCHDDTAHIDTHADQPAQPDGPSQTDLSLPELSAGTSAVVLAGDPAGNDGLAFFDESGRAFISLAPTSGIGAQVIYRRANASAPWHRVPAPTTPLSLTRRFTIAAPVAPITADNLAGHYQSVIGDDIAAFTINDAATIDAAGAGCRLAGRIAPAQRLAAGTAAHLSVAGCAGTADGDYDGLIVVDTEAINAAWHFIGAGDGQVLDIYAFLISEG
ncbi:hypothetical protein [Salinisphaera japonica]|uniref:Uncharacterized protein n=1 Tax=Salinisphaera japonica YTM-1 TaxID=1209778 RepID=A0A423Q0F4_9GAMM|nr:hypothetical protein [Salinisphaera japonica]ROO31453.1 hypothetical protein SAJA_02685 [Salinisphaera japonica YTM-1]